jgi:hypothetical protein
VNVAAPHALIPARSNAKSGGDIFSRRTRAHLPSGKRASGGSSPKRTAEAPFVSRIRAAYSPPPASPASTNRSGLPSSETSLGTVQSLPIQVAFFVLPWGQADRASAHGITRDQGARASADVMQSERTGPAVTAGCADCHCLKMRYARYCLVLKAVQVRRCVPRGGRRQRAGKESSWIRKTWASTAS